MDKIEKGLSSDLHVHQLDKCIRQSYDKVLADLQLQNLKSSQREKELQARVAELANRLNQVSEKLASSSKGVLDEGKSAIQSRLAASELEVANLKSRLAERTALDEATDTALDNLQTEVRAQRQLNESLQRLLQEKEQGVLGLQNQLSATKLVSDLNREQFSEACIEALRRLGICIEPQHYSTLHSLVRFFVGELESKASELKQLSARHQEYLAYGARLEEENRSFRVQQSVWLAQKEEAAELRRRIGEQQARLGFLDQALKENANLQESLETCRQNLASKEEQIADLCLRLKTLKAEPLLFTNSKEAPDSLAALGPIGVQLPVKFREEYNRMFSEYERLRANFGQVAGELAEARAACARLQEKAHQDLLLQQAAALSAQSPQAGCEEAGLQALLCKLLGWSLAGTEAGSLVLQKASTPEFTLTFAADSHELLHFSEPLAQFILDTMPRQSEDFAETGDLSELLVQLQLSLSVLGGDAPAVN